MWTNKKKAKGQTFLGNYERGWGRHEGKRVFKLKNSKTGREITFSSHEAAKQQGWVRK